MTVLQSVLNLAEETKLFVDDFNDMLNHMPLLVVFKIELHVQCELQREVWDQKLALSYNVYLQL